MQCILSTNGNFTARLISELMGFGSLFNMLAQGAQYLAGKKASLRSKQRIIIPSSVMPFLHFCKQSENQEDQNIETIFKTNC